MEVNDAEVIQQLQGMVTASEEIIDEWDVQPELIPEWDAKLLVTIAGGLGAASVLKDFMDIENQAIADGYASYFYSMVRCAYQIGRNSDAREESSDASPDR